MQDPKNYDSMPWTLASASSASSAVWEAERGAAALQPPCPRNFSDFWAENENLGL